MTSDLRKCIDLQIEINQSKNLLHKDANQLFRLLGSTIEAVRKVEPLDSDDLNLFIGYAADKVLQEFCRVNQYYSFDGNDVVRLKTIYRDLYQDIISGEKDNEVISQMHYERLKEWLDRTNGFSRKIYPQAETVLESVTCSEYSAELQSEILCLHDLPLEEPILDIGCGKMEKLVRYLSEKGYDVYGIDRFSETSTFVEKADWLACDYGIEKWGTIVSNLGFSNHFVHHHLREDGDFIRYAKKYVEILRSLKFGGCFSYAPDLPFIEKHLDRTAFVVNQHPIAHFSFKTTIVTRRKELLQL